MKYILIPIGAMVSALAQILLKKTSLFQNWTREWLLFLFLSCFIYGISFFIYLYLLRMHPISKIYPTMTLIVIIIITIYGFFIGEKISVQHMLGLILGGGAIYLLLGVGNIP